ncbi:MAG: septal ring lytic transglycosylase RlpA family protein [Thermodesulfovibrionales bacterium]|nr:septal ring lytic transglycosylase RlpA family protein [Thermodesulfovibrionales bacterium]
MRRSRNGTHTFALLFFCSVALSFLTSCAAPRYRYYEDYPKYETQPKERPALLETKYIVASWYGPDFHGKLTSSGEPYNMHANTCAHKEYPFGTKLKVTNILNSKSVECAVNDRGPFIPGRDLDLSYACAKEIELIGPGTGKVRTEYLGRDMRYIKYIKYSPTGGNGPFTIQIGSYKDLSNATRMKASLEFKYATVYITEAEISGGKYYRVRVGKFNSKDDAFTLAKTLADEGYNTLVAPYGERI